MSELDRVKSYFFSKHIHASDLWMESCIQWYKSEHSTEQVQIENLLQEIYEQWLLCDLRDMEIGSLPEKLISYTKINLQGKYAVQMQHVIDTSQPAYNQLKTIRNKTYATDENDEFENRKVQSKRVLCLHLCDGLQIVKGMEYRPISKLNTNLAPGIKLLIHGPVECRRGVLFLEEQNVEILGGEVEDLLIKNAYENVLAREINLPENLDPFSKCKNEIKTEETNLDDDILIDDDDVMAQINIDEIIQTTGTQNQIEPQIKMNPSTEYDKYEQELQDADFNIMDDDEFFNNIPGPSNVKPSTNFPTKQHNESFDIPGPSNLTVQKKENPSITFPSKSFDIPGPSNITKMENPSITFPIKAPSQPFVYIEQLSNARSHLKKCEYVVKARFKSLISKLNFSKNQWSLKCEIEDSTGTIAVNFSNRVLEQIIGYTADEMSVMRRQFATSNFHKDQILQALEKAKEKILSLADLITLDFSVNCDEPTIVNIRPITYDDMKLLEKRISIASS